MERKVMMLRYSTGNAEFKEVKATIHLFSSVEEAIEKLGIDAVLQHINYSHGLLERQKAITVARKKGS